MPSQNDTEPTVPDRADPAAGPVARPQSADDRAAVCALAGDLDIETLAPAATALDEAIRDRPDVLVVDLEQVGFCDSSGLNMLLKVRMAANAAGTELRLAGASPTVLRLLELTGADTVFSLHPDIASALTAPR